jgi:elongation factor 1-gamma
VAALHPYFSLVLDGKLRESIPHVLRWFLYVANIKEVASVLGKPRLCFTASKPSTVSVSTEPKFEVKVEKKDEKKVEKKVENKVEKKVEKKEEKKPELTKPTPTVVDEEIKQKTKNPLDVLPPTTLDLDSFKKEFLNTTEKKASLDKLWTNYDANGWSIWFVHYNKSPDQGKLSFKTCNLKSNFLQVRFFNIYSLL